MSARALSVLLFLSGLAALVLEVAWFRRLAQVAGATSTALGAVLAAVIGGMAAGSLLFGARADRARRPIRFYAAMEAGVTVAALVSPWLFDHVGSLYVWLPRALGGSPVLHLAAAFVVSALLLAPATLLMGGTLPAAAAALASPAALRGRHLGALYGVNTLGAVVGTVLTGFVLLPHLGLAATTHLAGAFSGAAAVLALVWSVAAAPRAATVPDATTDTPSADRRRALVLCAVSGFLGLACEVTFTRALLLVFGGTTYAFTVTLAVFLLGIGLGGLLGASLAVPGRALRRLETTVALTAGLFSAAALVAVHLPRLYVEGFVRFGGDFDTGLLLRVGLATVALLPGAIGLGAAFPLGLCVVTTASPGRRTGALYAANAFASIAGSTVAVFVLVPWLGPDGATVLLCLAVAAAIAAWTRRPATVAALVLACVGLFPVSTAARSRLLSGVYFNPWSWMRAGEVHAPWWDLGADLRFVAHGREATVSVTNWYGGRVLLVNGKPVASDVTASDAEHLALLGHLPMLAHPDPRRVLVVGLGMGTTYTAVAKHQPDELTVVEIEEAVREAADFIGVHAAHVVIADARTYLRATDRVFDVITSDPIHPFVRGGGDLYTREYYAACRARLAPGGVMCQWVPLYQMGVRDVADVIRTFCETFRATAYFTGADLVLLGGVDHEPDTLRAPQGAARDALIAMGALDPSELRVASHAGLLRAATPSQVLTDDSLRLEFSTPRQLDDHERADVLQFVQNAWEFARPPRIAALVAALVDLQSGRGDAADRDLDRALELAPDDVFVRRVAGEAWLNAAMEVSVDGDADGAQGFLDAAADLLGDDPRLLEVGIEIALGAGDRERARELAARLLERFPDDDWVARRVRSVDDTRGE